MAPTEVERTSGSTSTSTTEIQKVDPPPRNMGKLRWALTIGALYSSVLLYGLDTTIVADVQVPIIESFGHLDMLTWIGAAFPLGSVAVILPMGAIYALFDIKWIYIGSVALFEGGSALCGGAPNMNALILGRLIAGIGGAGIYLGNLNFVGTLTTIQERPVYVAGMGICWGAGAIFGPLIGGAFSQSSATWRWAFYINLVVAAMSSPVFIFSLPSIPRRPGESIIKKFLEIDILGAMLVMGIFSMFIVPLTFAGGSWQWQDTRTVMCLVLCGIFVLFFIIQQKFSLFTTPERRIFPVDLLYHPTLILLFICTAATSTNLFLPIYYIPLYFQFTHGDDSLHAAVRLLPFVLIGVSTSMLSGALMPRVGYYMPFYVLGGSAGTLGGALMYTVKSTTATGAVYAYSIPVAIGAGCSLQLGYSISQALLPRPKVPSAVRFMNMSQLGGTTIALTISGRVFQTYALKNVQEAVSGLGFSSQQAEALISGTQGKVLETLSPEIRAAVLEGIVKAISKVYILVIAGASTTLVCSFLMKRERLFQTVVKPVEIPIERIPTQRPISALSDPYHTDPYQTDYEN